MAEKNSIISAAVDLSGRAGYAAASRDGELLFESVRPVFGREGALLPEFISGELEKHGIKIADVKRWTVGSGPGSFSGLRLAASLVEGITFGTEAEKRCVPSALSYVMQSQTTADEAGVLFDGRNSEILFFGVKRAGNGEFIPDGRELVLNREAAEKFFADFAGDIIIPRQDAAAVEKVFAPETAQICDFHAADLLNVKYQEFDGVLSHLVYIRPAVYV